jgi:hypothetical protein
MNEIKEFLIKHPAISVRFLEKELEIPLGTIRISGGKHIPEKYKERIMFFLERYGMINSCKPERKQYFFRNNHLLTKQDKLFVRVNIGDNTPLYLE